MKIRLLAIAAGPKGTVDAESIVDVPDAKAQELIDSYHAVPAEADARITARWPHGYEASAKGKGPK